MKAALLLSLLLAFINLRAQNVLPQKVIFKYAKGGNSFGSPGVYGKEEVIEMELSDKAYKIKNYYHVVKCIAYDSITHTSDTTWSKSSRNSTIAKSLIDSLMRQLTTNKDNFTVDFMLPKLNIPSRRSVVRLAQEIDRRYLVEDDRNKLDKERIDKYRGFEKLQGYIRRIKPDPAVSTVVVDVWDNLEITFESADSTRRFRCDFTQPLGQPVYEYLKGPRVTHQVVNLEINTYLEAILPRSSIMLKSVAITSFTNDFVRWLLDPDMIH